jgi:hypothetical protein
LSAREIAAANSQPDKKKMYYLEELFAFLIAEQRL